MEDNIAALNLLPVDNLEAIDQKMIDERLTELEQASRHVREQIGIVSFRHSPAGDRRTFNQDRRSGSERRLDDLTTGIGQATPVQKPAGRKKLTEAAGGVKNMRAGAERRSVPERRLPHDERSRELETLLRQLGQQNQQLYRLRDSMVLCRPRERRPMPT